MESTTSLNTLVGEAEAQFLARFGRPARWVVNAPGRVNLIGEHTDYNDGFVLPMAIERSVVIAADRSDGDAAGRPTGEARVFSADLDQWATLSTTPPLSPGPVQWSSYVQGPIAGCIERGMLSGSWDAVVHSNVPLGGGLSSSAALEVATATLVEALTGKTLDALEKVFLCQKAEHDYAGMPCGIMDQFSSIMGQADCLMLLDCRSQTAQMVRLSDPSVSVLIANTNVKHELTGGEYSERRQQCEESARLLDVSSLRDATRDHLENSRDKLDDVHYRRARHVVTENARTVDAAAAIHDSDWPEVGRLMFASHTSLRDDYEVSCRELDLLVELARSIGPSGGVFGSRMTGGGFGGCTVTLVRADKVVRAAETLHQEYLRETEIEPTIFATRPAQGASIVKRPHGAGA